jgi:RIO1 family
MVALTPRRFCYPRAFVGDDPHRLGLYRAFAAACDLQARIIADTRKAVEARNEPLRFIDFEHPSISQLRRFDSDDPQDVFRFQIEMHIDRTQRINSREIYIATSREYEGDLVVKFVQRYSLDLHLFCYNKAHAPKILGYQQLSGGWWGIAMECLPHARTLDRPELASEIRALVDDFHHKDLVHGDLRECNILCTDEKWWVIDFDWSGVAGEVEYPHASLTEELLIVRGGRLDLKITVEDDLAILDRTLARVAGTV